MKRHKIPSIPENARKALAHRLDDEASSLILVRLGGAVYCYRNSCPHTGVNLDWVAGQFLDPSGSFIQCATHGALFRIADGFCIHGPCAGDSLVPVPIRIEGDSFEILDPMSNA